MSDFNRNDSFRSLISRPLISFIMALLGVTAAYFTTIGSIEVRLAEKAEAALVETIDKRLARLEVVIREGRVGKDEFFQFRNDIERRLTRIEFFLTEQGR
nr:hypothetical protein [candidate division Zixibacteria bacterium]